MKKNISLKDFNKILKIGEPGIKIEESYIRKYPGKSLASHIIGKVDVDANQEFAAKYGVRNIPTVLVFNNGEVVGRQVGVSPKTAYTDAIDALL